LVEFDPTSVFCAKTPDAAKSTVAANIVLENGFRIKIIIGLLRFIGVKSAKPARNSSLYYVLLFAIVSTKFNASVGLPSVIDYFELCPKMRYCQGFNAIIQMEEFFI